MQPIVAPQLFEMNRMESAAEMFKHRRKDEALAGLESIFINMMFQAIRRTVPDDQGIFAKSHAMKTIEGMMDEYMSQELAKSGQLGIARLAAQQLKNQTGIDAVKPEDMLESLPGAKVEDS
jgi:Rod binding domain-containing protein